MRVHFGIHNRAGVLSIFDSFTPSCHGTSLPPCTVKAHVLPDSHHHLSLDFHHRADGGKFDLQLASALPSLLALTWPLRYDIDHRLLDLPRHSLLLDVHAFSYTRAV